MRKLSVLMVMFLAACGTKQNGPLHYGQLPSVQHAPIVGGTLDSAPDGGSADPSVVELFYLESYSVSECNGNSTCTANCFNPSTGTACTSGANCMCGGGATCTSELIGPHSLVTAGHCTDTSAGGELAGQGGPALTLCTTNTGINDVLSYTPDSTCNLVVFAIFNNTCATNDENSTCEINLIFGSDGGGPSAGGYNFIFVDQLTNPGYSPNTEPPGDDNDIGLAHLQSDTLENGGCEPDLLTFNRADEGAVCNDLGSLKFVGYGITSSTGMISGVKMTVTHEAGVLDSYHNYEGNPSAIFSSTCDTLGSGEPTCSGDSGGPSLNTNGVIMAVTSLGDQTCRAYGQDSRIDAHAQWLDTTMTDPSWGDAPNGSDAGPSTCNGPCNTCYGNAQNTGGACASELATCEGDTACATLISCTNGCSGNEAAISACVTSCETTAGTTATNEFNAISTCACNACSVCMCGPPTTTTTNSSSSSGSVAASTGSTGSSGPGAAASTSSGAASVAASSSGAASVAASSSGAAASVAAASSGAAAGSSGSAASVAATSSGGSSGSAAGTNSGNGSGTNGNGNGSGIGAGFGGTTGAASSAGAKGGGCGSTNGGAAFTSLLPLAFLGLSRRRRLS